jgi:hypothetical protein
MSNRGSLVASPNPRPKLIAETASYIPLFWLSFLTANDLHSAENPGQYELDRKEAINRSATRVPLFAQAFPDVPKVDEIAASLVDVIKVHKSKTIGIELVELISEDDHVVPPLEIAVKAVDAGKADFALTIPGRTIRNPFSGEDFNAPERTYRSLADVLLAVCMVDRRDLKSKKRELVRECFVGHVWDDGA